METETVPEAMNKGKITLSRQQIACLLTIAKAPMRCVEWNTARSLIRKGLATHNGTQLEITDEGRRIAEITRDIIERKAL